MSPTHWVTITVCAACYFRALGSGSPMGESFLSEYRPAMSTNPWKDGWVLTGAGDKRFSSSGRRELICPECAKYYGVKGGDHDQTGPGPGSNSHRPGDVPLP